MQLRPGVWLHRSWFKLPRWGRVPANGVVLVGKTESLLIDTPWTDAQVEWLFGEVRRRFGAPITRVVVTHSHEDCAGGLAAAHRLGAVSYALKATAHKARAAGKPVPQRTFVGHRSMAAAGTTVELFYPGPGHTTDNIVVHLPAAATLFGGCLIKSAAARSLGNTREADMGRWAASVEAVAARYPRADLVVPGHGAPGGRALLTHTLSLIRAQGR